MNLSNFVTSAEHAFAISAADLVKAGKFVLNQVKPALVAAQASEAQIEAATAVVCPSAVNIERVAYAALGALAHAIDSGAAVAADGGLNVTHDAQLVSDVKSLLPLLKLNAPSVSDPAAPAAAAASPVAV